MLLIPSGKHHLNNRVCYTIDLQKNNLPLASREFKPLLLGSQVEIENLKYLIKGVEAFAIGDDLPHKEISILVETILDV